MFKRQIAEELWPFKGAGVNEVTLLVQFKATNTDSAVLLTKK